MQSPADPNSRTGFGKTWLKIAPRVAAGEMETSIPNLVAQASGIVLEIGAGTGTQLSRYDKSKITKIYGVEPNVDLHDALRAAIKKNELSDIYTIVPCGIEDEAGLRRYGIGIESVDTILTVQVLCSVPRPVETVKGLYGVLRKGGQMIVFEHVKSVDVISRAVQRVYNLIWPFFIGNCRLDRPTKQYLLDGGHWSLVELEVPKDEDGWLLLPRLSGRIVK